MFMFERNKEKAIVPSPDAMTPEDTLCMTAEICQELVVSDGYQPLEDGWLRLNFRHSNRTRADSYNALNALVMLKKHYDSLRVGEAPELAKLIDIANNQMDHKTLDLRKFGLPIDSYPYRDPYRFVPNSQEKGRRRASKQIGRIGVAATTVAGAMSPEIIGGSTSPLLGLAIGGVAFASNEVYFSRKKRKTIERQKDSVIEYIKKEESAFMESSYELSIPRFLVDGEDIEEALLSCDVSYTTALFPQHFIKAVYPTEVDSANIKGQKKKLRTNPKLFLRELDDTVTVKPKYYFSTGWFFERIIVKDNDPAEFWHQGLSEVVEEVAGLEKQRSRMVQELDQAIERQRFTGHQQYDGELENLQQQVADANAEIVSKSISILPLASERYVRRRQEELLERILGEHKRILELATFDPDETGKANFPETLRVFTETLFSVALKSDSTSEKQVDALKKACDYIMNIGKLMTSPTQAEQFYKGLLDKCGESGLALPAWEDIETKFITSAQYE